MKAHGKTGESDWEQTEVEWFEIESIDPKTLAFDEGDTLNHLINHLKNNINLPIIE